MNEIKTEKLSINQLKESGVFSWPIWVKEPSRFEWTYQCDEQCYILEGDFVVKTDTGNVQIKAGEFVTFKSGLKYIWDIKKTVKKHYNFP